VNSDHSRPLFSIFNFQFSIAAVAAAYACHFAAYHDTPIDRALPLIGVVIVFVAWAFADVAVLVAVPALMVVEIAVADEGARLVGLGVVVAAGLLSCWVAKFLGPTHPAT